MAQGSGGVVEAIAKAVGSLAKFGSTALNKTYTSGDYQKFIDSLYKPLGNYFGTDTSQKNTNNFERTFWIIMGGVVLLAIIFSITNRSKG